MEKWLKLFEIFITFVSRVLKFCINFNKFKQFSGEKRPKKKKINNVLIGKRL